MVSSALIVYAYCCRFVGLCVIVFNAQLWAKAHCSEGVLRILEGDEEIFCMGPCLTVLPYLNIK